MTTLTELSRVQTTKGIVGDLAISPNGQHVLAIHGGFRGSNWKPVYAASFVTDSAIVAPAFGHPAFVRDDGAALALEIDLKEIWIHVFDANKVCRVASFFRGAPTFETCARLDADQFIVEAEDRDDGHGYETPTRTAIRKRVNLQTGEQTWIEQGVARHYRGPATSFVTPNQTGPFVMPALPFRREWPVALGMRRFLTDRRIFEAADASVLLELEPGSAFEDLAHDETSAIAVTKTGDLQVWDIETRALLAQHTVDGEKMECARFAGASNEIVAGTERGLVLRFALR